MDVDGLWSVAVNGGEEAPVLDFPKASFWGYWALVEKGIYFVTTETGHASEGEHVRARQRDTLAVARAPCTAGPPGASQRR